MVAGLASLWCECDVSVDGLSPADGRVGASREVLFSGLTTEDIRQVPARGQGVSSIPVAETAGALRQLRRAEFTQLGTGLCHQQIA